MLVRIRGVNCRCLGAVRWLGCLEGSLGFSEEEEGIGSALVFLSIVGSGKVEGEGEAAGFYLEGGTRERNSKCKHGE